MRKVNLNRRQHKRLRIDRSVLIPIHIFPVLPFLGHPIDASVMNISSGGMALVINLGEAKEKLGRGEKLKIHFRLPGHALCECSGTITQNSKLKENVYLIGVRFLKTPSYFSGIIEKMTYDNDRCDTRIQNQAPLCELSCSFFHLCRKPIRASNDSSLKNELEIAFQHVD